MSYKLFLDDERTAYDNSWTVVRSYDSAINTIKEYGCPSVISFDHDLGDDYTGYDLAKEIVRMDMDGEITVPNSFVYYIHSANPIGAKNIDSYLSDYLRMKFS